MTENKVHEAFSDVTCPWQECKPTRDSEENKSALAYLLVYFNRPCIFTKVGRIVQLNKSDHKTKRMRADEERTTYLVERNRIGPKSPHLAPAFPPFFSAFHSLNIPSTLLCKS